MYNMELNFSELDNTKTMNNYESFNNNSYENHIGENYWLWFFQPRNEKFIYNFLLNPITIKKKQKKLASKKFFYRKVRVKEGCN